MSRRVRCVVKIMTLMFCIGLGTFLTWLAFPKIEDCLVTGIRDKVCKGPYGDKYSEFEYDFVLDLRVDNRNYTLNISRECVWSCNTCICLYGIGATYPCVVSNNEVRVKCEIEDWDKLNYSCIAIGGMLLFGAFILLLNEVMTRCNKTDEEEEYPLVETKPLPEETLIIYLLEKLKNDKVTHGSN